MDYKLKFKLLHDFIYIPGPKFLVMFRNTLIFKVRSC
jgi:hypothetical protein